MLWPRIEPDPAPTLGPTSQHADSPPPRPRPGPRPTAADLATTMSPFGRFALAHALGVCGDLFVTVSLADSLFLSVEPGAAKGKILLYLLVTMTPFAVIAPLIGPALDRSRGGRRLLFVGSVATRAVLCLLIADHINGLLLYPLVFCALVSAKVQGIAKSAIVPGVVRDESELVRANSRLALIGVLAGAAVAPLAGAILKLGGGPWVLRFGAVVFVAATVAAFAIPKPAEAAPLQTEQERNELHARSILLAGSAMGFVRAVVGFFTFFAGFVLKDQGEPAWVYGLVIAGSALGSGVGNLVAPVLRRRLREESILVSAMVVPGVVALLCARGYGRLPLVMAAAFVALGASCARLAFDSIVQRDAPDADRGRAFARYETRFQIFWVAGGVLAVVLPSIGRLGLFVVSMALIFGGLSYYGGDRGLSATR